jgi:hypothetical protein
LNCPLNYEEAHKTNLGSRIATWLAIEEVAIFSGLQVLHSSRNHIAWTPEEERLVELKRKKEG